MKILFVGDVIGEPGRHCLASWLPRLRQEHRPDFVVVNAENAAGGFGLTPEIAQELFKTGADVLTSGNHIWDKKQILDYLDREPRLLRPANYPEGAPGHGWGVFETTVGGPKLAVLNLEGRVYMHNLVDPFDLGRALAKTLREQTPLILVDFHAEVTSEKRALGWHLDGLVTGVVGTHTHVQTADEEVLPQGTAYITDAGMTGGRDSVIGVEKGEALRRFLTQLPTRFTPATGRPWLNGVLITADPATGRAESILRIQTT
jgi:2',3'-cyclic-nucleotide 2'-phosphodiesterase